MRKPQPGSRAVPRSCRSPPQPTRFPAGERPVAVETRHGREPAGSGRAPECKSKLPDHREPERLGSRRVQAVRVHRDGFCHAQCVSGADDLSLLLCTVTPNRSLPCLAKVSLRSSRHAATSCPDHKPRDTSGTSTTPWSCKLGPGPPGLPWTSSARQRLKASLW